MKYQIEIKGVVAICIIAFLLIIAGTIWFYWFQWRPSQIRQRCFAEAEFDKRATLEFNDVAREEFINTYYEDCLMRFGLK